MRLLLLGASGAVGSAVLNRALTDSRVQSVVAPTRGPLSQLHNVASGEAIALNKLLNPIVKFDALASDSDFAAWWQCDAVVCALGTTMANAGSESAFAAIDRDLVLLCAQLAKRGGATRFALNSSLGASLKGNFYMRTKAQAEQAVQALNFDSYTIVRPSLIDAKRANTRIAESLALIGARLFKPLIPKRYRAVSADWIAATLLGAVLDGRAGVRIIESEAIVGGYSSIDVTT